MQTINKYERVYSWLINELELNKINHPSEDVRVWLAMLQESLEYNSQNLKTKVFGVCKHLSTEAYSRKATNRKALYNY